MCVRAVRNAFVPEGMAKRSRNPIERGQHGADEAEDDQPVRALGEHVGFVGDAGRDVEAEAGDPRTDRHGDEERMERVTVGARQRRHRALARWSCSSIGAVLRTF